MSLISPNFHLYLPFESAKVFDFLFEKNNEHILPSFFILVRYLAILILE